MRSWWQSYYLAISDTNRLKTMFSLCCIQRWQPRIITCMSLQALPCIQWYPESQPGRISPRTGWTSQQRPNPAPDYSKPTPRGEQGPFMQGRAASAARVWATFLARYRANRVHVIPVIDRFLVKPYNVMFLRTDSENCLAKMMCHCNFTITPLMFVWQLYNWGSW